MNKDDFFDLLDGAKEHFSKWDYEPKGLRIDYDRDPFNPKWKVWIVGPGSIDPSLVMATDTWPIKGNFKSEDRAVAALAKYNRWFNEWKGE